ncbi:hypothetical protein BDK51DRAFT_44594 [Blyttiomyces helicus]|uniref:Uncharacterized protein n=1 Tax=Blyttiomyces helicus TaxID=388810 RepID=A0A4P9WJE7_9FUNG|nr:hypothetical protein BDK51DRAFT_44594 [Blyttiomyces helicus]|eukprot:RKO91260.1 hypothetical protein BDK51DRAFT_44594 [Blyttiomyces helicus]
MGSSVKSAIKSLFSSPSSFSFPKATSSDIDSASLCSVRNNVTSISALSKISLGNKKLRTHLMTPVAFGRGMGRVLLQECSSLAQVSYWSSDGYHARRETDVWHHGGPTNWGGGGGSEEAATTLRAPQPRPEDRRRHQVRPEFIAPERRLGCSKDGVHVTWCGRNVARTSRRWARRGDVVFGEEEEEKVMIGDLMEEPIVRSEREAQKDVI